MSFAAGDPPYRVADPDAPAPGMGPGFAVGTVVFSLLLWSVTAFQIVFVIPWFQKTFNEFRMAIPWHTRMIMEHTLWIVAISMFLSFLLCGLIRVRWLWIVFLIVLPIMANLSIFVNLYYPYMKLLEGLGGQLPNAG